MKIFFLLLAVLSLNSCGANNNESQLNDVGTDISERGSSGQSYMYWREGELVKRGSCDRSDLILRRYCQTNVQELAFADVRLALVGEANLQRSAALAADIVDIEGQIKTIEELLAQDPGNEDLLSQRNELRVQLNHARNEHAILSQRETLVDGALAKITDERLVYSIKAQGERYAEFKLILQELARLFNALNKPTDPATPEWTNPATSRTYMVSPTTRNYFAAVESSCDQSKGWRILTCAEAQRDALDLLRSPLISAASTIATADDETTRAFWTSCSHQHSNVRPGLLFSLGQMTAKVVFFTVESALPAICIKN